MIHPPLFVVSKAALSGRKDELERTEGVTTTSRARLTLSLPLYASLLSSSPPSSSNPGTDRAQSSRAVDERETDSASLPFPLVLFLCLKRGYRPEPPC